MAVVGLGAVGSATASDLTRRGHKVLGLDRFAPPHSLGSSHSDTRMIREAYYHDSHYTPLVNTAFDYWTDLETRSGRRLLQTTGALTIGQPESFGFSSSLQSIVENGSEFEGLASEELHNRYPVFTPDPQTFAIYEHRAGVLSPEHCIETLLEEAEAAGANLRFNEPMINWRAFRGGIEIQTENATYQTRRLAVATGAWTTGLFPDLPISLEVERTVQHWFEPATVDATPHFAPNVCPPWVWEYGPKSTWYGFPKTTRGIKVGMHVQQGRLTQIECLDRNVAPHEESTMRHVLARFMPSASGPTIESSVCMYTKTPDEDFILDRHPDCSEIVIFAGGSGHAFKFALVLGELVSDLLTDQDPAHNIQHFRLTRF